MTTPRLISPEQAAERLGGVPVAPLLRAAEAHGFLIRFGASRYLREDELRELIEVCREGVKAHGSTGAAKEKSGKSETAVSESRPARRAAAKLKARSQPTSPANTAQVVPLARTT